MDEIPTSVIGIISFLIVSVIGLIRDKDGRDFLLELRQKRSKADEELIKELQREKDITETFMEMLEDDELVIKYKTLQRMMRSKGKKKKDKNPNT